MGRKEGGNSKGSVGRGEKERWVAEMVCFSGDCVEVGTIIHLNRVDFANYSMYFIRTHTFNN